jgi:hypothetical protein
MKEVKKYSVLIILFILPLVAYLFFSRGVNNFVKLPTLEENIIVDIELLDAVTNDMFPLDGKINLIMFFGDDVATKKVAAMNLKEKVYDKNRAFNDFQVVTLFLPGQLDEIYKFIYDIELTSDISAWRFAEVDEAFAQNLYNGIGDARELDVNQSSNFVYIFDKNGNLRGRPDDEDYGLMKGYNMAKIADLNNKMVDDVKVILAEYRLELKRLKADREI